MTSPRHHGRQGCHCGPDPQSVDPGCCNSQPECADSKGGLQSWYDEVVKANWKTPQNIKEQYSSASICGNHRVVFNIAGNKYRLVVEMQYRAGIAWVKFIGTHARYDQINVESVNEY